MSLTSNSGDSVDRLPSVKNCKDSDSIYKERLDPDNMRALYKLATSLKLTSEPADHVECFYGVYIPYDVRLQCGDGSFF